jgi:DNA modification methylase
MQALLKNPAAFYRPKKRPSGHDISSGFGNGNGGAIPSNLLQIPNTESNSKYLRQCDEFGVRPHPARFPIKLPLFFINFLTDPGDLVVDIFSGSNTTGEAAEQTGRKWIACDSDPTYVATSAFRFFSDPATVNQRRLYEQIHAEPGIPIMVEDEGQLALLHEQRVSYTTE